MVEKLYNYKLKKDYEVNLSTIDVKVDVSFENYTNNGFHAAFPTAGKTEKTFLNVENETSQEQYDRTKALISSYKDDRFYICEQNGKLVLTLFPYGEVKAELSTAIEAVSQYYRWFVGPYFFKKKKEKLISETTAKLKSLNNYYTKSFKSLEKIEQSRPKNELADILMANLHVIKKNISIMLKKTRFV